MMVKIKKQMQHGGLYLHNFYNYEAISSKVTVTEDMDMKIQFIDLIDGNLDEKDMLPKVW